jgi:hypothetical protein
MKILFDQGTPYGLINYLFPHEVLTSLDMKWSELKNGDLLVAAEAAGFDLLITTDKNLKYQQNLIGRKIAVIVLMVPYWPKIKPFAHLIQGAVARVSPSAFIEVDFPSMINRPK